jgi:O-methyltransferase
MSQTVFNFVRPLVNKIGIDIIRHFPSSLNASFPEDYDQNTINTILKVKPFTMTSKARLFALCEAVKYIVNNQIPGDIVECGVWKGGSMMAVADTLISLNDYSRSLHLFDTFDGMTEPTEKDVAVTGSSASNLLNSSKKEQSNSMWCYAPLEEVKQAVYSVGYPSEKIHFVKGKVEDTIPQHSPSSISLLRLDTDWYESTHHELVHLFPLISPGGVIIIDDYGFWQGARKAVDEYIKENKIKLLLNRIDSTGRVGVVMANGGFSH